MQITRPPWRYFSSRKRVFFATGEIIYNPSLFTQIDNRGSWFTVDMVLGQRYQRRGIRKLNACTFTTLFCGQIHRYTVQPDTFVFWCSDFSTHEQAVSLSAEETPGNKFHINGAMSKLSGSGGGGRAGSQPPGSAGAGPTSVTVIVRSPFRAKHHVVVQFMARWMKCPLSPSPLNLLPPPHGQNPLAAGPPLDSMTGGRQGGQGRIDDITDAARDLALQLP